MRFVHSASLTLVARGLALPIGIASSIITARALGPEGRGVLATLMVLQGLAIQFGTLGFNGSLTYFLSHAPERSKSIVGNSVTTALGAGIIVAVLFAVGAAIAPDKILGDVQPALFWILLTSLPFTFLSQFLQNVFVARGQLVAFNVLDLIVRMTLLATYAVVLLVLNLGTDGAVWSFVCVSSVSGLIYATVVYRREHFGVSFDRPLFREMFRYGSRTYAASILSYLVLRLNMLLINPWLGEREAGLFSVVLLFMDLVALIPQTLGLILFPEVARDNKGSAALTVKVFRFTFAGVGALSLMIVLGAEPLIRLLFGEEFIAAAPALQWLTPGILAMALMIILNNDMAGRGLPRVVIVAPAIAVVVSAILHAALLSSLGLVGSSIATSVAFVVAATILYRATRQSLNVPHRSFWFLTREDIVTLLPSNLLRHR